MASKPLLPLIRLAFIGVASFSAATLVGCADGNDRAAVSGKVTLDGEPVGQGSITFFPTDGNQGPNAGANIENGTYKVPAATGVWPGKNRVEIHAKRKTGKKIPSLYKPGETIEEAVEIVPERYNAKSTLIRDIQKGKHEINFELSSAKSGN